MLAAARKPDQFTSALAALESAFVQLAQKKTLAIAVAGLLPLVARALLLPILPVPKPAIQDEFSYLLASDTFASGRLANPTPAFAEHFETLQELIRPVYASKYPPLAGLVMAAAQKLTGEPWVGVWLSMGVLCAVLCWALQGWLPAVWALTGTLIAVLHIGIVSYWTESYWSGTCTAIGGALLIGAVVRLIDRPRVSSALAFAAGLAVLANTRPFEGFVFALVCSGYLVFEWVRDRAAIGMILRSAVLPMALLLIPVAAWMGYYNYRVTGHALELPYVAHDRQYALLEPVLWQTHVRREPAYSNAFLRDFWQADLREKQKAHGEILEAHVWDFLLVVRFLLGLPLAACMLLVARPLWRDPIARRAALLGILAYLGPALDTRVWPHYAAAETVLAYILAACALRALRNAWPGVDGAYLMWGALLVVGRPVPRLRFLQILSGDEPALTPGCRFYQRLLAMDHREARQVLEKCLEGKTLEELYDSVLIPALSLAEQDRHENRLEDANQKFICQSTRELIDEFWEPRSQERATAVDDGEAGGASRIAAWRDRQSQKIVCVPARDEADEIVAIMLAQVLETAGHRAQSIPLGTASEMLAHVEEEKPDVVCISALPPFAIPHVRSLYAKLRAQDEKLRIVVGWWNFADNPLKVNRRLGLAEGGARSPRCGGAARAGRCD